MHSPLPAILLFLMCLILMVNAAPADCKRLLQNEYKKEFIDGDDHTTIIGAEAEPIVTSATVKLIGQAVNRQDTTVVMNRAILLRALDKLALQGEGHSTTSGGVIWKFDATSGSDTEGHSSLDRRSEIEKMRVYRQS